MEKTAIKKISKQLARKPKIRKSQPPKKEEEKTEERKEQVLKAGQYYEAVGRRKTSIARVRIFSQGEKIFTINNKSLDLYFSTAELRGIVMDALDKMTVSDKFRVQVLVKGGGLHSQAEAIRHGIARTLVLFNPDFRKRLKKESFLTRDPRMRERKKFGLKRARRAPQWQKR